MTCKKTKTMNKNKKSIFLTFFALFVFFSSLFASHISGGDMSYKCLGEDPDIPGNNIYEIRLRLFRDCINGSVPLDGGPGAQFANITIYHGAEFFGELLLDAPAVDIVGLNIDNSCFNIDTSLVCTERGIYIMTKSLPISMEDYVFVYQRCCRSEIISNIENPGDVGATFYTRINAESQSICNSSPVFDEVPPYYVCVGELSVFPSTAFDLDGDSLVYRFCAPDKGGANTNPNPNTDLAPPYNPVEFILPATANNPTGTNPPITIDPLSGIISTEAVLQGVNVIGVCVEEYRNGVLLSEIRREFLLAVNLCLNPVIELSIIAEPDDLSTGNVEGSLTVTPEGGAPPYTFEWNDASGQTTEQAVGLSPGTYTVTVVDANGCEAFISGEVGSITAVDAVNDNLKVALFPNPNTGLFYLHFESKHNNHFFIDCYNSLGQKCYSDEIEILDSSMHLIDLIQPLGIYHIVVKDKGGQLLERFSVLIH